MYSLLKPSVSNGPLRYFSSCSSSASSLPAEPPSGEFTQTFYGCAAGSGVIQLQLVNDVVASVTIQVNAAMPTPTPTRTPDTCTADGYAHACTDESADAD